MKNEGTGERTAYDVLDEGSGRTIELDFLEEALSARYYTRKVPDLDPRDYLVLKFVLDRTVSFGKVWEKINARHLTDGIRRFTVGFDISTRTVYRAFSELQQKGLVSIIPVENNYRLISLSQYIGYLTAADGRLFTKHGLGIGALEKICQEGPAILFKYDDRISEGSGQYGKRNKEEL